MVVSRNKMMSVFFTTTIALHVMVQEQTASAFTTPTSSTTAFTTPTRKMKSTVARNFMVPGQEHMSDLDMDSLQTSIQAAQDVLQHHLSQSSSLLLSDAAEAVADLSDAVDSAGALPDGWWGQYLSVFKSGLALIHSAVDDPLRSVGWEQTWGPSIFLFTFGVRSLLLPLSLQQAKSTEYTKALKPYQDEIKQKFKGNQDMINRATAKLFEDSGNNPLSGCLISLSQIPIFLGLYRAVNLLAKDGALNEPFLWIPSLEGPVTAPNYRGMEWLTEGWTFTAGNLPVPALGWETTLAFLVMPVVLVLGQSFTMKVMTPDTDTSSMSEDEKKQFEQTQNILKFLPLMIGYFSLQVPAGLTIYWLTSNFFTLTQSLAVRAYYKSNPPVIELPDYWDALDDQENMSAEDKRAAAAAGIATGPSFDDMLDEAKFHYVVERNPLREQSAAWERVKSGKKVIPAEFAAWVGGTSAIEKESSTLEKAPASA